MSKYQLVIHTAALSDIQDATDWYNEQSPDLGRKYQKQVMLQIDNLANTPSGHAIRYANVRCMIIRKFPFLVHFIINEDSMSVDIIAVIHTSRSPKVWKERRSR